MPIGTTTAIALGLGGASALGGLFRRGGGQSKEDAKFQRQLAQRAAGFGGRFEQMGFRGLRKPFNYYSGILSGDRSQMMQAIAPEARQVTDLYQQGLQQRELTPRGGGTSQLYANLPFQQARSIMDIYQRARPAAAQGLAQIGQAASQNVLAGYGTGLQGGQSLMNYNLYNRQLQYQQGAGIGRSIFDIIKLLGSKDFDLSKLLGGAGGCWVLSAVYGSDDWRTKLIWAWMTNAEHGWEHTSRVGKFVVGLYWRFGERVAAVAKRSRLVKAGLRKVFDRLLRYILKTWR